MVVQAGGRDSVVVDQTAMRWADLQLGRIQATYRWRASASDVVKLRGEKSTGGRKKKASLIKDHEESSPGPRAMYGWGRGIYRWMKKQAVMGWEERMMEEREALGERRRRQEKRRTNDLQSGLARV